MQVFHTHAGLARAAAAHVARLSAQAVQARGRFTVALSGGSLVALLCPGLLADPLRTTIQWLAWDIFWADERCVRLTDDRSNYRVLRDQLLDRVEVPSKQVHPVNDALSPEEAAEAYQATLAQVFRSPPDDPPRFDLILLGMGEDGHTASLFPGHRLLRETRRWAAALFDSPKPPPERVTLTMPVLNHARHVVFIAAGAGKAMALGRVFAADDAGEAVPARLVRPADGEVVWFVDGAAATQVPGGGRYAVGR